MLLKPIVACLMTILFALALSACGSSPAPVSEENGEEGSSISSQAEIPSSSLPSESLAEASSEETSVSEEVKAPIVVADAMRYTGIIDDFAMDDAGQTVLILRPLEGDGTEELFQVTLTENTKYSVPSSYLGNGAEIEVYYTSGDVAKALAINAPSQDTASQQQTVSVPEDALSYIGTVISVTQKEDGSGSVHMKDSNGKNEFVFLFSPEDTNLLVDMASVEPGALLEVKHSPVSTRSLPPQSVAYQIGEVVMCTGVAQAPETSR